MTLSHVTMSREDPVTIRGRSKLSTFMKAYRGYARGGRGGRGLETTVRFFSNINIIIMMLITDNKSTFYSREGGGGRSRKRVLSPRFRKC